MPSSNFKSAIVSSSFDISISGLVSLNFTWIAFSIDEGEFYTLYAFDVLKYPSNIPLSHLESNLPKFSLVLRITHRHPKGWMYKMLSFHPFHGSYEVFFQNGFNVNNVLKITNNIHHFNPKVFRGGITIEHGPNHFLQ